MFMSQMKTKLLALFIAPLLFTGCASIVDGGPKAIHLNSNPEGAKVTISNKSGEKVAVETTPATVGLKRASGFAQEEDYKLVFEKEGYYPHEAHIKSTINGWYFGNILCGGLIGCLVDMGTGSCYTLSPGNVGYNLVSSVTPLTPDELKAAELKANPVPIRKAAAASPKSRK
jgi:hypothetical protein